MIDLPEVTGSLELQIAFDSLQRVSTQANWYQQGH